MGTWKSSVAIDVSVYIGQQGGALGRDNGDVKREEGVPAE